MLTIQSEVSVKGITGQDVMDFMLNCTDTDYQNWWPGTHLAFHTIQRRPNNLGNLVYFDEYIGRRRLKFKGIVTEIVPGQKITWQMQKGVRLPARLIMKFEERADSLRIIHILEVGFRGIGRLIDPFLRLYFTETFITELDQHAQIEFPLLGEILSTTKGGRAGQPGD